MYKVGDKVRIIATSYIRTVRPKDIGVIFTITDIIKADFGDGKDTHYLSIGKGGIIGNSDVEPVIGEWD